MYFITGFIKYELDARGYLDIGGSRTFGYYETEDDAIKAVLGNYCDIFEYMYDYVVVEHIKLGLYNQATNRWFFKWNDTLKKYEAIEPLDDHWGNYAFG